jgi:hypothetical protein
MLFVFLIACGGAESSVPADGTSSSSGSTSGGSSSGGSSSGASVVDSTCTLVEATTATDVASPSGCHVLTRDTSACKADREAAGLGGFWLRMSCRVKLTATATAVTATFDGQPDYKSNYFASSDVCHEAYDGAIQNPNLIKTQAYAVEIPRAPDTTAGDQRGGTMGVALNGVPLFNNSAAPGDDIFLEAKTFDRCGAHPNMTGTYHYHSEPYSITYDDSAFVGVLRDGYPVYGRRDVDGSLPSDLDEYGGHTAVTSDSPTTATYHYHVHEETSTKPTSVGEKQWFLMTGKFRGSTLPCTSCGR